MEVIAYITEATVVEKILTHLKLPTAPLPLSPARRPARRDFFDDIEPIDDRCTQTLMDGPYRYAGIPTKSRAPPISEMDGCCVDRDEPFDTGDFGA
jgi:hypothetical protein